MSEATSEDDAQRIAEDYRIAMDHPPGRGLESFAYFPPSKPASRKSGSKPSTAGPALLVAYQDPPNRRESTLEMLRQIVNEPSMAAQFTPAGVLRPSADQDSTRPKR
jgi:hypothetical protein